MAHDFLKPHFDTEGPLGFPMPDKAARAVDALLRTLPKTPDYEYRKALVPRPPTELNPGERSDVSWISTESVDRTGEVVGERPYSAWKIILFVLSIAGLIAAIIFLATIFKDR